jgi:hypothetical protein
MNDWRGMQGCSWLRHCFTSWNVAGSISNKGIGIFHWLNPCGHAMALCSTQPLIEISNRAVSWGWRCSLGCNFPNFMFRLSGNSGGPHPPAALGDCAGLYRDDCTFGLMNDWNYGGICTLTQPLVWNLEDVRCFNFVAQCTNFLCMQEVCKTMHNFMVRREIQLSLMCIFLLLVMLRLVLTRLKVNAACCTLLSLYFDPFWCLILPTWLHICYFLDR